MKNRLAEVKHTTGGINSRITTSKEQMINEVENQIEESLRQAITGNVKGNRYREKPKGLTSTHQGRSKNGEEELFDEVMEVDLPKLRRKTSD